MSTDSQLATTNGPRPLVKASAELSAFLGMEVPAMLSTLKAQCFKNSRPDDITDAQLAAFVSVANALKVNPLIPGFLYAYPTKNGGIEPIAGPDTTFKKLDEKIAEGVIDGYECTVFPEDIALPPTHAVCIIERANGKKPAKYIALKSEWYVDTNPNWKYKMRHMLWLRGIKQCARQVIHGLPMDNDEYKLYQMQNVTPDGDGEGSAPEPAPQRPAPPKRSPRGAAAVVENKPTQTEAERRAAESGQKIVEGEFTQETKPNAEDQPRQPPAEELKSDMAAREAKLKQDKLAEKLADPAEAKKAADATEAAPRAFLKDGEEVTVTATVKDIGAMMGNYAKVPGTPPVPTPLVQLEVTGGFNGRLWHWDGGTADAKKNVTPNPLYVPGATLKFTLLGKLNNISKKVVNLVQKVEALEVPAGEQVEMS